MHDHSVRATQGFDGTHSWVERTALFRNAERVREAVSLHKWYESEKAGYDIGWDRAKVSWLCHRNDA